MQAVILAGGEGCRLRPLTLSRPKAMIPVANRPIIDYTIDALLANGIREITVVVGYRKEQVMRHLTGFEEEIGFVVQERQLGPTNALLCARDEISDDFILLPGDNYIDAESVRRIMNVKNGVLIKKHPYPSNFGVVEVRDDYLSRIVEKPQFALRHTVSTGIMTLSREIFKYLGECEIPDALNAMVAAGHRIRVVEAAEWNDAIYPWDLIPLSARVMKKMEGEECHGTIHKGVLLSGAVRIGEGTTIGPNTTIIGPAIIGENCEIGPHVCIMPNTCLGSRVHIGPFTYLQDSLVMDDVSIGSHGRITGSVIGTGSTLADHTVTIEGVYSAEEEGGLIKGKFGAILGEEVSCAPFTVLAHCIVGNHVSIEEGRRIAGLLQDGVVVK